MHRRQLTPIESDTIRFCTFKVFSAHKFISQIDVSPNEYNMICCCCCENVDSCRVDVGLPLFSHFILQQFPSILCFTGVKVCVCVYPL